MRPSSLTRLAAGLMLTAAFAAAQAETLTGTVSDSMCGKKHMMSGKSDAECTRACVKEGSDYALVVGDKVYTLKGDKAQLDKFAGAKVVVDGATKGDTFTAKSIKAAP
jgi:hypothetical protein